MSAIFLLLFVNIFCISKSEILWSDPLDSLNGGNGINWTANSNPTGSISAPYTTTIANCPNRTYCWELKEDYFVYYAYPTLNFDNISLTISVSAVGLETGTVDDACSIYYSIDGNTTNWNSPPLATWTDNAQFPILSYLIALPSDASNNIGIGIKLQSESNGNGNKLDYCYFSDVIFRGNTIQPTTSMTTTATPTTSIPTTAPITSMPTPPTTMAPTSNPTTTTDDDAGDPKESDGSDGMGEFAIFGIIGGVFALLICVSIIVQIRHKKSKEKEATADKQKMAEEITSQYMDAYKHGVRERDSETTPNNEPPAARNVPAPPIELTDIFGPTQAVRVSTSKQEDSDDDSIRKKQAYWDEH